MSENAITIELSETQIAGLLGEVESVGLLVGLIGGVQALAELQDVELLTPLARSNDPRFSRALLRGLMVLASFPVDGAARTVAEVAGELGLGVSTTHRYASTLLEVGLLERDPVSREYRRATRG